MITELKKDDIYMWVFPETAAGLKFKVLKILHEGYMVKYLNYRYLIPETQPVIISHQFVESHIMDVLRVVKA